MTEKIEIANGIDDLKNKILDVITEYEKKYKVRVHISNYKYDHLADTKDFDMVIYNK